MYFLAATYTEQAGTIASAVLALAAVIALLYRLFFKPTLERIARELKDEVTEGQRDIKADLTDLREDMRKNQEALRDHMITEAATTNLIQNQLSRLDARQSAMEAVTGFQLAESIKMRQREGNNGV